MPVPSSLSPWERWHRVSDDGEGKPVSKEHPHSDMHWLLSERYYRSSYNFPAASLPSQSSLRDASSPKGGAFGLHKKAAPADVLRKDGSSYLLYRML